MNVIENELLEWLARGALLLAVASLVGWGLRRRGAALLSTYWRCAVLAVLLLPLIPKVWTVGRVGGELPVKVVMPATSQPVGTPGLAPGELAEVEAGPSSLAPSPPVVEQEDPVSFEAGRQVALPDATGERLATAGGEKLALVVDAGSLRWLPMSLVAIWALGALFVFARWLMAALRFRMLWRRAVPAGDASLHRQFRELSAELGLRRAPMLMTHSQIAVPMAGGMVRPRILLPNDCALWEEGDRRLVLQHELVHVKRRDALFHLLASLAKALHWPNPLMWIAVRQMRSAAERATDDQVLEGGTGRPEYARLLVEFASRQMSRPRPSTPAVASSMAKPDTVEARVLRILDPAQHRARPGWLAVSSLATSFVGLLALAGGVALAEDRGGGQPAPEAEDGARLSERLMTDKLAQIILPEIDFSQATLAEAIEFCSARSRELDPEGRGVNIIATPGPAVPGEPDDPGQPAPATISLQLRNIPLGELLRYVGRLSGRRMSIEPHSIVFRSDSGDSLHTRSYELAKEKIDEVFERVGPGGGWAEPDPFGDDGAGGSFEAVTARDWLQAAGIPFARGASAHYEPISGRLVVRQTLSAIEQIDLLVDSMRGVTPAVPVSTRGLLRERMAKMVIPKIDFTEATMDEAVDYLRFQSEKLSGDGRLNLVVVPENGRPADAAPKTITLQLQEIPFEAALEYVAEFCGYHVRVDPHAVVLAPSWSDSAEDFELTTFPITHTGLRETLGENSYAARSWLSKLGVTFPEYASAYFDPVGNNLIVRNRSMEMALIEATLKKIEASAPPADPPSAEGGSAGAGLGDRDRDAARNAIVFFHDADTVEKRLAFVRDPQRVKPLMEAWYAENEPIANFAGKKNIAISIQMSKMIVDQGREFVIMAMDVDRSGSRVYAVEKTAGGMKLDWETAVRYQPMALDEFKEKRPTEPQAFRVKVKPSDYYNHQFADDGVFRSLELSYPGDPGFKLFGFVDRSAGWAQGLLDQLEAGGAPSLIVKLRYPEGEIKDATMVQVDAIVSETWWP